MMPPLCFPFDVLSRVLSGQEIVGFIASLCSGTSFQQSTKQCSGTLAPTVSQILDRLCLQLEGGSWPLASCYTTQRSSEAALWTTILLCSALCTTEPECREINAFILEQTTQEASGNKGRAGDMDPQDLVMPLISYCRRDIIMQCGAGGHPLAPPQLLGSSAIVFITWQSPRNHPKAPGHSAPRSLPAFNPSCHLM